SRSRRSPARWRRRISDTASHPPAGSVGASAASAGARNGCPLPHGEAHGKSHKVILKKSAMKLSCFSGFARLSMHGDRPNSAGGERSMPGYPFSLDGRLPPTRTQTVRPRWKQIFLDQLTTLSLLLMAALLLAIVLFPYMVITVSSGQVGVLWLRFRGGTVLDPRQLKEEGLRFISPWNKVFLYDLRLQSQTDTYNAISKDGVSLTASINIRFRLKHDAVPQLHQSIGPNYLSSLVVPEIGSRMREVIADYTAEEVYSTKRQEIQDRIRGHAEAMLGGKMMERGADEDNAPYRIPLNAMLNLIDTLVLSIELPESIVTAIDRKIEQYYISEEYTFRG